ncbi:Acyl-CoA dehydrogenase [Arboricoccus pini]|uniref:Dibenzothiophene monooxygenase n=1 Tax=Arboricoccus pini TaxID=1963835 RepID=A0A212QR41_9PROT|nr:acyl-CoA dehydrogenase family protein [Arboricoccus pini]SNB61985.1 Acyl-CoA dehydrogenase [Arboricoccus pini]
MSSAAILQLATPAAPRLTRAGLLGQLPALVDEIAAGAVRRDLERELPYPAFQRIKELRLGALRIPEALGGPGGSVADYIELIATLGAADSNVAHALRSHFDFTEGLLLDPTTARSRAHLENVLSGKLYGAAHTEQGTKRPGEIKTALRHTANGWRLDGRKWYATGTAFADFAVISAQNEEGVLMTALVPTDRQGIQILDDWDGMGQKLTASGGIKLDNVEVRDEELVIRDRETSIGRHTATLRQLHLAASAAGAIRAVLREGIDYVRKHARTAPHSPVDTARHDPFVQNVVGEIAAASFAIDASIAEAARALDRSVEAFGSGSESAIDKALIESSIATSRAQIVLAKLGQPAAQQIFELGGGSATSSRFNLDRHWRNLRTILNHNPLLHKARVIGDFYLNGTTTHLREGRVF